LGSGGDGEGGDAVREARAAGADRGLGAVAPRRRAPAPGRLARLLHRGLPGDDALRRWAAEGPPGLEDRSRAPRHHARKVDLRALAAVRRLQVNPAIGGFRASAALEQQGIALSPRTCRRLLARHRELGAPRRERAERERRPHPFAAAYRHHLWSVDIRYIEKHQLADPKPV
jgi:hypothetical protein